MQNAINLSENRIKQSLKKYLITEGWNPEIIRRTNRGYDICALRNNKQWIITYRCDEHHNLVETFILSLGSTMHIMEKPNIKYSIALPDTLPFRRLWSRLPFLAKNRMGITALFVDPTGNVTEVGK